MSAPDPTALAAWVAERKAEHIALSDRDDAGNATSHPYCGRCGLECEEPAKLAVIEAAATVVETNDCRGEASQDALDALESALSALLGDAQ